MPWTLYAVPTAKKAELDAALADDVVARQSQKIRAASALGGAADRTYVLVEGTPEGVHRAEQLIGPLGEKPADAPALYAKFKDEEEAASAGMGLFFGDAE